MSGVEYNTTQSTSADTALAAVPSTNVNFRSLFRKYDEPRALYLSVSGPKARRLSQARLVQITLDAFSAKGLTSKVIGG
jgi:hypothetical protein